jgi:uncharacterized Zn finger protein
MIATSTLAKVDNDRLQCGVAGLTTGAYHITLTRMTEQEISAHVRNGDRQPYPVTLTEARAFCGCPDSMYRGMVCKHATALALHVIRTASEKQPRRPDRLHVGDVVQRNEHRGTVIAVADDFVSIRWEMVRPISLITDESGEEKTKKEGV